MQFLMDLKLSSGAIFENFSLAKFREISGFFYLIIFDKINRTLSVFSSLFSILPLYYLQNDTGIFISSRVDKIAHFLKEKKINNRFIL